MYSINRRSKCDYSHALKCNWMLPINKVMFICQGNHAFKVECWRSQVENVLFHRVLHIWHICKTPCSICYLYVQNATWRPTAEILWVICVEMQELWSYNETQLGLVLFFVDLRVCIPNTTYLLLVYALYLKLTGLFLHYYNNNKFIACT